VKRNLGLLIGVTLALWVLLMYPARWLGVEEASLFSSVAVLLCLLPAAATLAWAHRSAQRSPEQYVMAALGGTVVRMAVVLGVGLSLYLGLPDFHRTSFWIWVSVFYLFTLALEVILIVTSRTAEQGRLQ
jgi:type IV secretory pathway VirB2 component (pilin)